VKYENKERLFAAELIKGFCISGLDVNEFKLKDS